MTANKLTDEAYYTAWLNLIEFASSSEDQKLRESKMLKIAIRIQLSSVSFCIELLWKTEPALNVFFDLE